MMKGAHFHTAAAFALLALATFHLVSASDPSPLQDFCVAFNTSQTAASAVFLNGKFCKDPKLATADDFFFSGSRFPETHQIGLVPMSPQLMVMEGTLYVGFVTSNPDNRLFTKVLCKGDVFVFPVGLIHFQFNIGEVNAVAIAAFSSQNPGVITIANAVFGSNPPINPDVLIKAFQVDNNVV